MFIAIPETLLPYSKQTIKAAFKIYWQFIPTDDKKIREALISCYLQLANFVPVEQANICNSIMELISSHNIKNIPPEYSEKYSDIQSKISEETEELYMEIEKIIREEKQSHNEIMQNALDQMEDQLKTHHSKNAILLFFVFGIIIFIWKGAPLLSLGALVFFFIGMFLASFLSIPSYLIKTQISKHISINQAQILKNLYWIFEIVYGLVVTYLLFYLYTILQ